ncbi:MAG: hypothetical protein ACOX4I_09410 [Anaerovoracaceae bacterium]
MWTATRSADSMWRRLWGRIPNQVFKTLVTRGSRSHDYFVFVISRGART